MALAFEPKHLPGNNFDDVRVNRRIDFAGFAPMRISGPFTNTAQSAHFRQACMCLRKGWADCHRWRLLLNPNNFRATILMMFG